MKGIKVCVQESMPNNLPGAVSACAEFRQLGKKSIAKLSSVYHTENTNIKPEVELLLCNSIL